MQLHALVSILLRYFFSQCHLLSIVSAALALEISITSISALDRSLPRHKIPTLSEKPRDVKEVAKTSQHVNRKKPYRRCSRCMH